MTGDNVMNMKTYYRWTRPDGSSCKGSHEERRRFFTDEEWYMHWYAALEEGKPLALWIVEPIGAIEQIGIGEWVSDDLHYVELVDTF